MRTIGVKYGLLLAVMIFSTFCGPYCSGQITLYNTGTDGLVLTIAENEILTIQGNMENQSTINNYGTILVSGDWTNAGNFNASNGSLTLNGNSTQHFDHANQSLFQFNISGSGEKILESDLDVTGGLNLTLGILTTGSNQLQVLPNALVEGGSQESFINGALIIHGTGDKYFPIGKNDGFFPVNLFNIQGNDPVIRFELFEPNPGPQKPEELETVSSIRYWEKSLISGILENARINLSFDTSEELTEASFAVVTEAESIGGLFQNLGRSEMVGDIEDGSVTSDLSISVNANFYAIGQEIDLTGIDCIPSAFSTSATNIEDRSIKVYCSNIEAEGFSFKIYNKWGIVVYETNSVEEATTTGWNGINNNTQKIEKNDVYRYTISGRFSNGRELKKFGTITKIN
ncbi:gliding motility-associated C-terminal domain-containing protein [Fulvivirgaceae bacterium BMA10]|uniref:Gliding motility-associated C-terminal domain-containing protein n=2 Tax=Splendidivirga corallicola TaxID=3051826 RepID=A0ABT8KTE9_9BACT|nr:gliding motility-associated C-terminal domain-containing protein [Fulvivirgaceae bacterium BMA10]